MSAFENKSIYRSAESVTPGHPDKICDQISDAILDAYLEPDPEARVAVEVAAGHGQLFITGEVTSVAEVDLRPIVLRLAGQQKITISLEAQSPEIAKGVDDGGAGDQGIMVGYACNQTKELMPLEVILSRQLAQYLYVRWPYDGKTQITLKEDLIAVVVASFQHAPKSQLEAAVRDWLATKPVMDNLQVHCNPAGDWQVGGFAADAGLTGRKLAVDNYGPAVPIGGGAFSGKDATKVDRSGAYMARKIARDYLIEKSAQQVAVKLAYGIGLVQPLQAVAQIDGRTELVKGYDLSPQAIIQQLELTKPQFEATARWGHFGHPEFSWES